ncbi:hypothetical protein MRB53_022909 [Persea americana]|uniref:Uncharacterized protein n=1 Tax=Persea americana TaxID=3435 RepID=A0ACC2L8P7_PERAE|nr:hypothetical protein MRB53_022909 [Persea americana]
MESSVLEEKKRAKKGKKDSPLPHLGSPITATSCVAGEEEARPAIADKGRRGGTAVTGSHYYLPSPLPGKTEESSPRIY